MTFAGGPLNNYVLQSTAAMAGVLRADPETVGLITAISAMITKQGVSLWSCRPPSGPFRAVDVSAAVASESPAVPVTADGAGPARVVTYTVAHDAAGTPERAVVLAQRSDGSRAIVASTSAAAAMAVGEWADRQVELDDIGGFRI